jgi:hypothetical protein
MHCADVPKANIALTRCNVRLLTTTDVNANEKSRRNCGKNQKRYPPRLK